MATPSLLMCTRHKSCTIFFAVSKELSVLVLKNSGVVWLVSRVTQILYHRNSTYVCGTDVQRMSHNDPNAPSTITQKAQRLSMRFVVLVLLFLALGCPTLPRLSTSVVLKSNKTQECWATGPEMSTYDAYFKAWLRVAEAPASSCSSLVFHLAALHAKRKSLVHPI